MGAPCSVRDGNPLKGFVDILDTVWRFTLSIAGRDPTPLFEIDDSLSATVVEETEKRPSSPSSPYNLRPRQPVNYRV